MLKGFMSAAFVRGFSRLVCIVESLGLVVVIPDAQAETCLEGLIIAFVKLKPSGLGR